MISKETIEALLEDFKKNCESIPAIYGSYGGGYVNNSDKKIEALKLYKELLEMYIRAAMYVRGKS